jgi:hypothetical protein
MIYVLQDSVTVSTLCSSGKPKDGNTYVLGARILNYVFSCVLCSHIEKEAL